MVVMRALRLLAVGAALLAGLDASVAQAHPHVWVTVETTVLYDDKQQITALKENWTFDKAYSQYALDGLEQDASGNYTPAAFAELTKENIESLKDYNYFTEIYVEGKRIETAPPIGATNVRDDKAILHFTMTVPLAQPIKPGTLKVSFLVYDPEFYISFTFAEKDPIHMGPGAPAGCGPKIEPATGDPTKSKTWGGAYAATVVVACSG
jgi:ABC-type uncharacterized transport system substrate-binding protein